MLCCAGALWQVVVAALIHCLLMFGLCIMMLPDEFYVDYYMLEGVVPASDLVVKSWGLGLCTVAGALMGLCGGYVGLSYTADQAPGRSGVIAKNAAVRELVDSCQGSGAAVSTITGLSLGYRSTVSFVCCLATGIYFSHAFGRGLGIAFAAMGAMGTVCSMTITTSFGPIAKNARAIVEMSGTDQESKIAAEQLCDAGNTMIAMSKGFSTVASALCGVALVETLVVRGNVSRSRVSVFDPLCFVGLLVGAMLPYALSTMVLHAVFNTAEKLKENIQQQFRDRWDSIKVQRSRPRYTECITAATTESLRQLVPIGMVILVVPLSVGMLLGTGAITGLLLGCILTAVPHAVSAANSGGLWQSVRRHFQYLGPTDSYNRYKSQLVAAEHDGNLKEIKEAKRKLLENGPKPAYEAAVVCETVGDPLKDVVAPSMSILLKDLPMIAIVMIPFFASVRGGYGTIGCDVDRDCNAEKYPMEGFDLLVLSLCGALMLFLVGRRCAAGFGESNGRASVPYEFGTTADPQRMPLINNGQTKEQRVP